MVLIAGLISAFTGTAHAQPSSIGVNLAGDWLWADALRQGRTHWDTAAHLGDAAATEDSNNWPTEDCSLVVWEGHAFNDGTYALSFTGKATIAVSYGYGTVNGAQSGTGTYNAATNTTTATVVITDTGFENMSLIFTNTQRTAASATNTGITNVHFLRPITEGATTSYAPGTLFTNQTLAMSANFAVTRFMDQVHVINSTETNWPDRPLPGDWNQSPIAYEYIVAYGNATNSDVYINIPLYATSDYVTNLAYLIKYGSDGVNPYTSAQANPVYPPLNSNLHVYLEYSNEVWNGGFEETNENYNIVAADQTANNAEWAILNYDGGAASNLWTGAWRRIIYEAKLISDDFRTVFGDAAMPPNANAMVRPLIEFQSGNGQATGSTQLQFLDNYYNNSDGVAHVAPPHPVNYFLWGGGGATYYGSDDDSAATVDDLFASGLPETGYAAATQIDTALCRGYGLKRVAYEGGWSVYNGTNGFEDTAGTAAALAKFDPRATTAQVTAHTIFQQAGGDLNIFYTSSSWAPTYIWALTDEIFDLTTPLFQAATEIESAQAPAVTYGNAISSTAATTLPYGQQLFADSTYNSGLPDGGALGFVPLISSAGDYQVSLMINSPNSGRFVGVLLDGASVGGGPISVPVGNSPVSVVVGKFHLAAGQHGLVVQGQYASNNNYSGNSCSFTSVVLTPMLSVQITGQPQSQVATLGGSASFSVGASGTNVSYQWEFNGAPISGQTASTLSLTNLARNQAGSYSVLVTNSSGTVPSAAATLTVQGTYAQWANLSFTSGQLANPNFTGPTDVPENDGVPNLMKYYFDVDPSAPMSATDRATLPRFGMANGFLTMTYRQNPIATGVAPPSLETSTDLVTWQVVTPSSTVTLAPDPATDDPVYELKVPITSGAAQEFMRLRLVAP